MKDNGSAIFITHLRALPFVKRVHESRAGANPTLVVETADSKHTYRYEILRSHLSKVTAELWIGRARDSNVPLLLMPPYVSDPMGARLREAGVSYVDASGNVSLSLTGKGGHPVHVALIQGQSRAKSQLSDRAWRAESYQVLLTLLAEPTLLGASVRAVADRAEVSTSPVLQVREKLLRMGLIVAPKKSPLRWTPDGATKAQDLWVAGYHATLRPRLLIHRYRPRPGMGVDDVQADMETRLAGEYSWRWGGAAASMRVDGYYRGDRTVVHLHAPGVSPLELGRVLRMVPDADGPVILLQRPGKAAFELGTARVSLPPLEDAERATLVHTLQPHIVHPLLVWAELLEEGHDRSSEAATEWAARYLKQDGHADG
jgi:hypothetical protein